MKFLGKNNGMRGKRQAGFSLVELMVSVAILVIVSGAVMAGMINTTRSQGTVMNRTQMHAGVRNATELMEQEIGQAGKLGTPAGLTVTFGTAITANTLGTTATPTVSSAGNLFVGEQITVDPNSTNEETVTITAIASSVITAKFYNAHSASTVPALVLGGFASGIIPPDTSSMYIFTGTGTTNTTLTSGATGSASSANQLKLYGDIYGDGNMYFVIYKCSPNSSGTGTLTRYVVQDLNNGTAATLGTSGTILLDNLYDTGTSCFTYQTKDVAVTINGGQPLQTFVVNVAVTLSFQTQNKDTKTNLYQYETKALLNISPRNVFDAWQLASAPTGYTRAQPMPPNVYTNLLAPTLTAATN